MNLEIHTELACFQKITNEWCALLKNTSHYTIFQTPAFIHTWWQVYGEGRLHVITIRDTQNMLVAVCPLHIIEKENKKILTFISDKDVTDYQDFIIHKQCTDEIYSSISNYFETMLTAKEIDSIELFSLPSYSATRTKLIYKKSTQKEIEQDVCPVIELPHHWDSYLDSLERKQRHEVRRKMKKLSENTPHEYIVVKKLAEYQNAITTFIALHKASSQEKADFWDSKREKFFTLFLERAEEHNWLRLYFLHIEDTPVATLLIFEHDHEYQLYNSGFLKDVFKEYSIGQVLLAYTIKEAIEHGITRYDFLRGSEPYKFRLGGKPEAVWDVTITI